MPALPDLTPIVLPELHVENKIGAYALTSGVAGEVPSASRFYALGLGTYLLYTI